MLCVYIYKASCCTLRVRYSEHPPFAGQSIVGQEDEGVLTCAWGLIIIIIVIHNNDATYLPVFHHHRPHHHPRRYTNTHTHTLYAIAGLEKDILLYILPICIQTQRCQRSIRVVITDGKKLCVDNIFRYDIIIMYYYRGIRSTRFVSYTAFVRI